MLAHGGFRDVGVAGVDGLDDRLMLGNQPRHGIGMAELQIADPVHMRLDVRDRIPGERATRALGNGDVKLLVLATKGVVVVGVPGGLLAGKDRVDLASGPGVEALADAAGDGSLDRLAHETCLHHLPGRDANDDGAAVRADVHEFRLSERNQRLAHRLARPPIRVAISCSESRIPGASSRRMIDSRRSRSTCAANVVRGGSAAAGLSESEIRDHCQRCRGSSAFNGLGTFASGARP